MHMQVHKGQARISSWKEVAFLETTKDHKYVKIFVKVAIINIVYYVFVQLVKYF